MENPILHEKIAQAKFTGELVLDRSEVFDITAMYDELESTENCDGDEMRFPIKDLQNFGENFDKLKRQFEMITKFAKANKLQDKFVELLETMSDVNIKLIEKMSDKLVEHDIEW